MFFNGATKILKRYDDFDKYLQIIEGPPAGQLISGALNSQKSLWIAATGWFTNRPVLLIMQNISQAKNIFLDLLNFYKKDEIAILPAKETIILGLYAKSSELTNERIRVLSKLIKGELKCLIVTTDGFMQKLLPAEVFKDGHFLLKKGDVIKRDFLIENFLYLGYERVDLVQSVGQYSVRGDIIDIYNIIDNNPARLEFFDDELENIRHFDVLTQRSTEPINYVSIMPATEILTNESTRKSAVKKIKKETDSFFESLSHKGKRTAAARIKELSNEWAEVLSSNMWINDIEKFQPYLYEKQDCIIDYFLKKPLVMINEPIKIFETIETIEHENEINVSNLLEKGQTLPGLGDINCRTEEIKELLQDMNITYFALFHNGLPDIKVNATYSFSGKNIPIFQGRMHLLLEEIKAWKKQGYAVLLNVSNIERAKKLKDYLWDENIEAVIPELSDPELSDYEITMGKVLISIGSFTEGFEIPALKIAVVSEEEIFGKRKKSSSLLTYKDGIKIRHYDELKEGDYIVHVQYGIGKYLGLKQLCVGDVCRDYLHIQYYGQDKLYLPTDQIKLIQKYSGAEGYKPKLHKLGGAEWKRVKTKAVQAVQELAKQLLVLYAERENAQGYSFTSDNELQKEFEDLFPYEETQDQIKVMEEIKKDMEKPQPMDRLLCGDVGYGKTEIALRAAFKAVQDSKQVVILVPTTVLAQQHFRTFTDRMGGYPINVAVLSRFCSEKEQTEIIKKIKKGIIDIVIGTHRLLSQDVSFKDLGLLIVDEEQRFGVAHKERIKHIKKNVDVLTLTATPIPRTMHMALAGARNMSIIETPPENRYPVQTYVLEYDEHLIKSAINKELDRGGQVYFVHNRIADIEKTKAHIERLIPGLSIAIAHGRMHEHELEDVMLKFMQNEYQILLATTIIENGLDIANVNTLIVDEADKLGLSQLYQIKGRVGRTNRLAYAYFTYKKSKIIKEKAEKRLIALRDFTEFGSGFKIAKRDLEIRGAGNILGREQHGHMLAVGFDLYCKLLKEAVNELKGKPQDLKKQDAIDIDISVSSYISTKYIQDKTQIMEIYQELGVCEDLESIKRIEESLIDRFGGMPQETRNLIALIRIKVIAEKVGVIKIKQLGNEIQIAFKPEKQIKGDILFKMGDEAKGRLVFSTADGLLVKFDTSRLKHEDILDIIEKSLCKLFKLE